MQPFEQIKKYPQLILFLLALLVYGNSLFNEYALDDAIVFTQNKFVKQGIDGIDDIFTTESFTGFFGFDKKLVAGGRYRPLSIATFALEREFFGQQPFISHLINVLLYAVVVMLIYRILSSSRRASWQLAFVVALLFALHPIHTEAVTNIKGRDEILAMLFALLAAQWLLFAKQPQWLIYPGAALMLFLAMLSKEHAIAFVVLVPLAMFYLKQSNTKILKSTLALLIPALLFIFIRYEVLGGMQITQSGSLMNNPFVEMTTPQKYATILLTWLWYLKLLIFPHPLTYDYYPYHVPVTDFSGIYPWLSLIMVAALLFLAIKSLKNKKLYGYWIWFFIGTFILMSNLFFSIGTFMNERFLFMPSLAFCAAMGYGLVWIYNRQSYRTAAITLTIIIAAGYTGKTIDRNRDWKNDFRLFTHDVQISANSAKGNCVAGGQYYEKAQATESKKEKQKYLHKAKSYLEKSLTIHPTYNDAHLLYGNTRFGLNHPLDSVMQHYYSILSRANQHQHAWKNALSVLNQGQPKNRLKWYKKLYKIDSNRFKVNYNMGQIYGRHLKNYDLSERYLKKALKLKPNSVKAMKDIAVIYGLTKQYAKSVHYLQKVVKLKPKDDGAWFNLGISLNAVGKIDQAQQALDKAHQLNPKRKKIVLSSP